MKCDKLTVLKTVHSHTIEPDEVGDHRFLPDHRYMALAEVAYAEYFRSLKGQVDGRGGDDIVLSAGTHQLDFKRSVSIGDELEIYVVAYGSRMSNLQLCSRFFRRGELVATIESEYPSSPSGDASFLLSETLGK